MDIEAAIRKLLLSSPSIATRVIDRVRPFYGAQTDVRPFLTILVNSASGTMTHSGRAGSTNATVEIGIMADTYDDVKALAGSPAVGDGVRGVLDGYVGNVAVNGVSTVRICPCIYDDESDVEQVPNPGRALPVYVKTITFRVRFKAA